MKIFKDNEGNFYVEEEGMTIAEGKTPLEAACNAADTVYSPGSTFWHWTVADILKDSSPDIINHYINPFNINKIN